MWLRRRRRVDGEEERIDLAERLAPYIRDPQPVTVIELREEGDPATSAPPVPGPDSAGGDRQIAGAGERRSSTRPS